MLSFEFFPPKTLEGVDHFHHCAMELAKLSPSFFSVTFGAGGSTRKGTIETVMQLQQKTNIAVAPHLSCTGFTRDELTTILKEYQALGVKRIVALRGDMPSGMGSTSEVTQASDLVKLIRDVTSDIFHIEVAAYPEYHLQSKNAMSDVQNLKQKYEAGANSAITQYFFNSDAYFYFLDGCRKQHIDIPIVPGIMPIMNFTKLVQFSALCGAEIPRWLYKRLEAYGDDAESIKAFGVEVIYNLCERLLSGGANGLHFYTLNRAQPCLEVIRQLERFKKSYSV